VFVAHHEKAWRATACSSQSSPSPGPRAVAKRIDEMIAALKSKGAPIVWLGLPAIRGTKATSDMSYLNELYRERAEKAGIVYIDIQCRIVCCSPGLLLWQMQATTRGDRNCGSVTTTLSPRAAYSQLSARPFRNFWR
jgi:hypothetical protein